MWASTRVSRTIGVAYPILQGPFGGRHSTPPLAAAVSNAGGLGAFGAVGLEPEDIEQVVADIRERTRNAFAVTSLAKWRSSSPRPKYFARSPRT